VAFVFSNREQIEMPLSDTRGIAPKGGFALSARSSGRAEVALLFSRRNPEQIYRELY